MGNEYLYREYYCGNPIMAHWYYSFLWKYHVQGLPGGLCSCITVNNVPLFPPNISSRKYILVIIVESRNIKMLSLFGAVVVVYFITPEI